MVETEAKPNNPNKPFGEIVDGIPIRPRRRRSRDRATDFKTFNTGLNALEV
jgi:hypothetical protein